MIYFDNGATSFPKPKRVYNALLEAAMKYGANPGRSGHKMAMDTAVKVYESRESIAKLFHLNTPEDVVFCSNATHAINIALKGILKAGDHIIISDLEHNAVLRPVEKLSKQGVQYSIASTDLFDDDATVDAFASLIQPNTKMIACTHGSNVFGIKLPIEKIATLCSHYNILFLVDAAQTAGVVDINPVVTKIDFLAAAGHKSLYGPSGTGILITPHGSKMDTIIEGGTGSHSAVYDQPLEMPERLESGTVNTIGIIGLGAGVSYILEKGMKNIYCHEMMIARCIFERLSAIDGVTLYLNNFEMGRQLPVISFNIKDIPSEESAQMLSDKGFALRAGLHCAPLAHKKMGTLERGTVRISVGAFNNYEQAVKLSQTIKKIANCH